MSKPGAAMTLALSYISAHPGCVGSALDLACKAPGMIAAVRRCIQAGLVRVEAPAEGGRELRLFAVEA